MNHKDIITLKAHLSARNEMLRDTTGVLQKLDNETWLECAIRHAVPYGLEIDVKESYRRYIDQNFSEPDAALHSCYEWDVLPRTPQSSESLQELKFFLRKVILAVV